MTKPKIVVLTSYRSGSTAFCDILSQQCQVPNYDEWFHDAHPDQWLNFKKLNLDQGYVVKIMPDQIRKPFKSLIKNSLVLGLYRRDVISQLTSYFICHQTGRWHIKKNQSQQDYELTDYQGQIPILVENLLKINQIYWDTFKPLCHKEYIYEDLMNQQFFKKTNFDYYPKPKNYNKVKQKIQKYFDQQYRQI